MGKPVWTRDQKVTLRHLVSEGLTAREIAARMGKSQSSINQMAFWLDLRLRGRELGVRDHLVGNPFYEARRKAGLSREQAAGKIGLSYRALQKYELGEQRPSQRVLWESIAQVYGCSISDLLGVEVLDTERKEG